MVGILQYPVGFWVNSIVGSWKKNIQVSATKTVLEVRFLAEAKMVPENEKLSRCMVLFPRLQKRHGP